ncbi:hypothetical protein LY76DRAFT_650944 [Colletotrichum caudatum]|nr:hypothetical protein LY76DRAFT_650944 [Colletotrichum caudatum]
MAYGSRPDVILYGFKYMKQALEADMVYHVFNAFTKHVAKLLEKKKKKDKAKMLDVYPSVLDTVAVFNKP